MRLIQSCLLLLSVSYCRLVFAQTAPPPSFQQQSSLAFSTSGVFPSSIALSGTASWVAGSQTDSGTVSLSAAANGATSENWSFSTVSHSFTQGPTNFSDFSRSCSYTDGKGHQRSVTGPNCIQGLPWFFPSFVLQPSYAAVLAVSDQTGEAETAQGLEKLTYSLAPPSSSSGDTLTLLQKATSFTLYYDNKTALPKRLEFKQATDQDDAASVDIAVTFDDYRIEGGFMVPHHIARYMQRTLVLDFVVSNVTVQ